MPHAAKFNRTNVSRVFGAAPKPVKKAAPEPVASAADLLIYDAAIRTVNLNSARLTLDIEKPLQGVLGRQLTGLFGVPADVGWEIAGHLDASAAKSISRLYLDEITPKDRRILINRMAKNVLSFSFVPAANQTWSDHFSALQGGLNGPVSPGEDSRRKPEDQYGNILRARCIGRASVTWKLQSAKELSIALAAKVEGSIRLSPRFILACPKILIHAAMSVPELLPKLMGSNTIETNIGLAQEMIRNVDGSWKFLSKEIRENRHVYLQAMRKPVPEADCLPQRLAGDKECVLAAVKVNGLLLGDASRELQGDREILFAVVRQNQRALDWSEIFYLGNGTFEEKIIFVQEVMKEVDGAWQYMPQNIREHRAVYLQVMRKHLPEAGTNYLPQGLAGDKECVLAAVKVNGLLLRYASGELKKDEEVNSAAVRQHPLALYFSDISDDEACNDKDSFLVMACSGRGWYSLSKLSAGLRKNKELFLGLPSMYKQILGCVDEELTKDKNFVLALMARNGLDLRFAAPDLRNDRTVILAAVRENPMSLKYAGDDVLMETLQWEGSPLQQGKERRRAMSEYIQDNILRPVPASRGAGTALGLRYLDLWTARLNGSLRGLLDPAPGRSRMSPQGCRCPTPAKVLMHTPPGPP